MLSIRALNRSESIAPVFAAFSNNDSDLAVAERQIAINELPQAATTLNALRARSPDDARIYVVGAQLALAANNPEAALKSLDVALQTVPGWVNVAFQRAVVLEKLGRLQECLDACVVVATAAPSRLDAVDLAVNVGGRLGNRAIPETLLRQAQAHDPNNVRIWLVLGVFLSKSKPDEASALLERVVAVEPDNVRAVVALAVIRFGAKDMAQAIVWIERAERLNPNDELVAFQAARIKGRELPKLPEQTVRSLFDEQAENYDRQLVGRLNYRLPRIVATRIRERFPSLDINLLDLGCGTGLLGRVLGAIRGYFVGVDLSPKMLEKAAQTGVYSRLHSVDVIGALDATDANEYEVIVANDVLTYIFDIESFVKGMHKVLRADGIAYFSCELANEDEPDIVLRASERYAHRIEAVRALCERAGFASIEIEELTVRTESAVPIAGFLVAATKAA
jgi:predicted TPR repeat methyltransferase